MDFSGRVKQLRGERGLTHSQIAAFLGKSEGAVRSWEMSRSNPDIGTLVKLAEYFDVTTDYLLGLSDVRNQQHARLLELDSDALSKALERYKGFILAAPDNLRDDCSAFELIADILASNNFMAILLNLFYYAAIDEAAAYEVFAPHILSPGDLPKAGLLLLRSSAQLCLEGLFNEIRIKYAYKLIDAPEQDD